MQSLLRCAHYSGQSTTGLRRTPAPAAHAGAAQACG